MAPSEQLLFAPLTVAAAVSMSRINGAENPIRQQRH
jgi:hypothetical protein